MSKPVRISLKGRQASEGEETYVARDESLDARLKCGIDEFDLLLASLRWDGRDDSVLAPEGGGEGLSRVVALDDLDLRRISCI